MQARRSSSCARTQCCSFSSTRDCTARSCSQSASGSTRASEASRSIRVRFVTSKADITASNSFWRSARRRTAVAAFSASLTERSCRSSATATASSNVLAVTNTFRCSCATMVFHESLACSRRALSSSTMPRKTSTSPSCTSPRSKIFLTISISPGRPRARAMSSCAAESAPMSSLSFCATFSTVPDDRDTSTTSFANSATLPPRSIAFSIIAPCWLMRCSSSCTAFSTTERAEARCCLEVALLRPAIASMTTSSALRTSFMLSLMSAASWIMSATSSPVPPAALSAAVRSSSTPRAAAGVFAFTVRSCATSVLSPSFSVVSSETTLLSFVIFSREALSPLRRSCATSLRALLSSFCTMSIRL
eukprot:PhM_4_TR12888/c0_g1_i1/m.36481